MRRKCLSFIAVLSCILLNPHRLFAWGAGHEDQLRLVVQLLPQQVQAFFPPDDLKNLIMYYSHYPDSFKPIDPAQVGQDDADFLKQHGITIHYPLHGALGKALSFTLLVKAFREHNPAHAAIWAGALCHAIGDEAAINHDPLVHYFMCGFESYKLTVGKGVGLDLSNVARTPDGQADLQKLIAGYTPSVLSEDPQEALLRVMMDGPEGNAFMTRLGRRIMASYAVNAPKSVYDDAVEAIAESGAEGARRGACAVLTAWQFAQEGKDVEIPSDLVARFTKESTDFIAHRPLSDDSIYTGLLDPFPGAKGVRVGVLLEPSQSMNACLFSYGGKYIISAAMGTMKDAGVAYQPIDIWSLEDTDLPSPAQLPVLIVCAGQFSVTPAMVRRIDAYTHAGGKLLFIGGMSSGRGVLGNLTQAMVLGSDKQWPIVRSDLPKSTIAFSGDFASALGSKPYPIANTPDSPSGWQRPVDPYHFTITDPSVHVLAQIQDGSQSLVIAADSTSASGAADAVVVPEYLLSPFVFSGDTTLSDPSIPILDTAGKKILMESLKLLTSPNAAH